jgi:hypothetical protein
MKVCTNTKCAHGEAHDPLQGITKIQLDSLAGHPLALSNDTTNHHSLACNRRRISELGE